MRLSFFSRRHSLLLVLTLIMIAVMHLLVGAVHSQRSFSVLDLAGECARKRSASWGTCLVWRIRGRGGWRAF